MRDFDVEIKFKSLYNSLLISRVFQLSVVLLAFTIAPRTFPELINVPIDSCCYKLFRKQIRFLLILEMQIGQKAAKMSELSEEKKS